MNPSPSYDALAPRGCFSQSMPHFTPRNAQQEMAAAVEEAMRYSGTLVAESGTGTGKTFAYLVPIILGEYRAIVSTGTRHLQDQIFERDLPVVTAALGSGIRAVMLKGRANYLCRYRLGLQLQQSDLVGKQETLSFQHIERWASATRSGDISRMPDVGEESPIWKRVTSTSENCLGTRCPDYSRCFVVKARQEAMQADLVVVNHHLFFSDLTLKTEGFGELLPEHDAVVFDEAHSIGEIASRFFGTTVSTGQIAELGNDAVLAEREEHSGVEMQLPVDAAERACRELELACAGLKGQQLDYDALFSPMFDDACEKLQLALDQLEQGLALAAPSGDGLNRCHDRCLTIQGALEQWMHGRDSNQVRWAQVGERRVSMHSTPLSISDRFARMMEGHPASWIFTSATLAVGDDFSAFAHKLGLENAEFRRWDSPYDFRRNTLLYLPQDLPDPRQAGYAESLAQVIADTVAAARGRTFCLFTSYASMRRVHELLRDKLEWPLLMQGESARTELLERYIELGNAVLFGTASFWEGVDVKGEALSCVIIDKLPFASPSDPVLKYRLQACEEEGGRPFRDIQLPDAVIALKQGAGRLIRSESDRGVLVLCDPRISAMSYGKTFLASLPEMPKSTSLAEVSGFFEND